MMDPSQVPPNMRQMVMGPNGQMMRPPSSHPAMAGMTPDQLQAMRAQGMQIPNGNFAVGQPQPGQVMQGQQGAPAGQAQPLGTPRQQQSNMPPPPAPPAGNQPSSPAAQQPPPTPNQTTKPKPGTKKESANKKVRDIGRPRPLPDISELTNDEKGAANKKGGAANATATTEADAQPPTPTPATPATPMNPNSFAHTQNQKLPNGAPTAATAAQQANPTAQQAAAAAAAAQNAQQPPGADMSFGMGIDDSSFDNLGLDFGMSADTLDTFDFDSFLNDNGDSAFGLDGNFGFDGEIGLDGTA